MEHLIVSWLESLVSGFPLQNAYCPDWMSNVCFDVFINHWTKKAAGDPTHPIWGDIPKQASQMLNNIKKDGWTIVPEVSFREALARSQKMTQVDFFADPKYQTSQSCNGGYLHFSQSYQIKVGPREFEIELEQTVENRDRMFKPWGLQLFVYERNIKDEEEEDEEEDDWEEEEEKECWDSIIGYVL